MDDQTKNSNNLCGSSLRTIIGIGWTAIIYWYWVVEPSTSTAGLLETKPPNLRAIEVDPESGLVGSSRGTWVPFKDLQKACHAKKIWTMKQWSI